MSHLKSTQILFGPSFRLCQSTEEMPFPGRRFLFSCSSSFASLPPNDSSYLLNATARLSWQIYNWTGPRDVGPGDGTSISLVYSFGTGRPDSERSAKMSSGVWTLLEFKAVEVNETFKTLWESSDGRYAMYRCICRQRTRGSKDNRHIS